MRKDGAVLRGTRPRVMTLLAGSWTGAIGRAIMLLTESTAELTVQDVTAEAWCCGLWLLTACCHGSDSMD